MIVLIQMEVAVGLNKYIMPLIDGNRLLCSF